MAKNKKFKNTYLVTIEGNTTNGSMASFFDTMLRAYVKGIGDFKKQAQANIKVLETHGDFDAETRTVRES